MTLPALLSAATVYDGWPDCAHPQLTCQSISNRGARP
jgi:hypothetical protein